MSCLFLGGKYVSEDFLNECPERLNVNSLVSMPDLPAQVKQEPNSKLEYLERGPYGFEHRIPFTILWFITISPEKSGHVQENLGAGINIPNFTKPLNSNRILLAAY